MRKFETEMQILRLRLRMTTREGFEAGGSPPMRKFETEMQILRLRLRMTTREGFAAGGLPLSGSLRRKCRSFAFGSG